MRYIFFLFIIIPLAEMLLLFEVAEQIGGFTTLGLVVLTAVIGIQILKQQGLSTFTRANKRLESGELPAQEMVEGLFLAVGGAFLLTPGFITDTLGFMFLIGPVRRYIVKTLIKSGKLAMFQSGAQSQFFYTHHSRGNTGDGSTFEGEYEKEVAPDNDQIKLDKD